MQVIDLFTNPATNRLSHTRLWANVASLVATIQFIRLNTADWELWLVYLGSVGGYAVARKFLASRDELAKLNHTVPNNPVNPNSTNNPNANPNPKPEQGANR